MAATSLRYKNTEMNRQKYYLLIAELISQVQHRTTLIRQYASTYKFLYNRKEVFMKTGTSEYVYLGIEIWSGRFGII